VLERGFHHVVVVGDDDDARCEVVNTILLLTVRALSVEECGIGVTIFEAGFACALSRDVTFN
jgi:hypothetical protein